MSVDVDYLLHEGKPFFRDKSAYLLPEGKPFFKDKSAGSGVMIDMDELRKMRIMVGTPCMGAMCVDFFRVSYTRFAVACALAGIHCEPGVIYNESCIARARNRIAAEFLASDCTHLLWWDSDEEADYKDIWCMLAANLSIIAAPVRWKCDEERYAINYLPDGTKPLGNGAIQVHTIGTGLMLEQRRVFTTMIQKRVIDQLGNLDWWQRPGAQDNYYAFYEDSVDMMPSGLGDWHTEDFTHCKHWHKCGGRVWMWPYAKVGHWGGKMYVGSGIVMK